MTIQDAHAKFLAACFKNKPFDMPLFPSRQEAEGGKAIIEQFVKDADEYLRALSYEYVGAVGIDATAAEYSNVIATAVHDNSLLAPLTEFVGK